MEKKESLTTWPVTAWNVHVCSTVSLRNYKNEKMHSPTAPQANVKKVCGERAKTERNKFSQLVWMNFCCWSLYRTYVATGTLCSQCLKTYCVCSKPSLSCRSTVSDCSAQCCWLLYNSTDYSNRDNLQCTCWHTFFLSRLPSICRYLFIPALTCYFHLAQLNALLNALFPSVSFHYSTLLPLSSLSLSMSLWLHPKIPSLSLLLPLFLFFTVLSISRHLSALTI